MYLSHFGLRELPFSITPDPRFLYMSARHREALAHLVYGVGEHGGFVQLTGEVGTGKTSVCRCLLEQLPSHVDIALILNPRVSPVELLALVCDELRIPYPAGTDEPEGARGPAPSPPARGSWARPADRSHHRRGPESLARGAGGGAPPHESRDDDRQAPPGDPDRPAGAGGAPRGSEAPPARPARHGSVPSRAAVAARDPRLCPPPPGRGGASCPVVHPVGAAPASPRNVRHPAPHQRHRRSCPSWRLYAGAVPGRCGHRPARGGRGAGSAASPVAAMGAGSDRRGPRCRRGGRRIRPPRTGRNRPGRGSAVRPPCRDRRTLR